MADIRPTLDLSQWDAALAKLDGPLRVSLARSMAVAGGAILRDEAKQNAPVETGRLRDSIYLAFKEDKSGAEKVVYSVTWNSKTAPHGHLQEFGTYKMPANPFLRPAFDHAPRAQKAMVDRGRERLPELLAEVAK